MEGKEDTRPLKKRTRVSSTRHHNGSHSTREKKPCLFGQTLGEVKIEAMVDTLTYALAQAEDETRARN